METKKEVFLCQSVAKFPDEDEVRMNILFAAAAAATGAKGKELVAIALPV